jgi:SNF2 family DNA or RNA helicase
MLLVLIVLNQHSTLFEGLPVISDQLSRLHMILKPFMLRRIKKDVENELSDKVRNEVLVSLRLSRPQLRF